MNSKQNWLSAFDKLQTPYQKKPWYKRYTLWTRYMIPVYIMYPLNIFLAAYYNLFNNDKYIKGFSQWLAHIHICNIAKAHLKMGNYYTSVVAKPHELISTINVFEDEKIPGWLNHTK